MRASPLAFVVAALAPCASACFVAVPLDERRCADDSDCLAAFACADDVCIERVACDDESDCPDGRACGDGACRGVARHDGGPVDGGVTVDGGMLADAGEQGDGGAVPDGGAMPDGGGGDGGLVGGDGGEAYDAGPGVCFGAPYEVCAPPDRVRRVCEAVTSECDPALDFTLVGSAVVSLSSSSAPGYVFVEGGSYDGAIVIAAGDVTIVGAPGVTLYNHAGGNYLLHVSESAVVRAYNVWLTDDDDGDGDRDDDTYLVHVEEGGTLSLGDCRVGPSLRVGVNVISDGFADIRRCTVHGNERGGLYLGGRGAFVENVIVRDNGDDSGSGSDWGGAKLASPSGTILFRHTTIIGNRRKSGHGGVDCSGLHYVYSSIVRGNDSPNFDGDCAAVTSNISGGGDDAGNIDEFSNVDSDFRLQSDSPGIDLATGGPYQGFDAGPPDDDIDRDPRPQGGGYDMGADEYEP